MGLLRFIPSEAVWGEYRSDRLTRFADPSRYTGLAFQQKNKALRGCPGILRATLRGAAGLNGRLPQAMVQARQTADTLPAPGLRQVTAAWS